MAIGSSCPPVPSSSLAWVGLGWDNETSVQFGMSCVALDLCRPQSPSPCNAVQRNEAASLFIPCCTGCTHVRIGGVYSTRGHTCQVK
jgi:hypothetical protein